MIAISEVKENEPDIIFVLGDMLNDSSEDYHVAVDLTKGQKIRVGGMFDYACV